MGQIYEQALCTLIWTGETNPVPEDMSQFLTDISDDVMQNTPFSENKLREQLLARLDRVSLQTYEKLFEFIERPWFTRVWVYQEAVLSKKPYFVIGDCLVPLAAMHYMLPPVDMAYEHNHKGGPYSRFGQMVSMRHERETGFERPFYEVLMKGAAAAESSDPRDLVYEFLGVLSNPHIAIEPDCASSFEKVAIDAATAIIKGLQSLDILAVVRHDAATDTALPSWVPAWGFRSNVRSMYPTHPLQKPCTRPCASQG